ncbi:longitudinals lacking protein, isoforms A/B/D/L isoform X3 [Nilaparvata lugens]|uniref:longitudinals lacking protein, isoforms A/B/D/L isoform X3 n=1 Tax=Nilaparvata lugens TaxID=108931 RepID=UPI00193E515A|nr:longitudinals lacking protein, isoforms A/B/D/L isoform X3 [Nilaparvata lugens]
MNHMKFAICARNGSHNCGIMNENYVKSVPAAEYICPKCDNVFSNKNSLLHHLRYICGKVASQQCPYCPHITKLKFNLKTHILKKHNEKLLDYLSSTDSNKKCG